MKVTIFGSGYVGLVTGACLAEMGNHVVCVDVDPAKIELLNAGGVPIHEPGLDELIASNRAKGRLKFTTDAKAGVDHGLFQFIAVGTPPDEDGSADLRYVLAVAETIGRHMDEYRVVVDKSTVPVGTADKVRERIAQTTEISDYEPMLHQIMRFFQTGRSPISPRETLAIYAFMQAAGMALSTTHVATGSILGSGGGKSGAQVRWAVAGRMVVAWLITLPAAALAGALTFWLGRGVGAATSDLIGSIVIFTLLVALSAFMWWRAQRHKVDHSNVNADWDSETNSVVPAELRDATKPRNKTSA